MSPPPIVGRARRRMPRQVAVALLAGMLVYRALATVLPACAGAGALAELRLRRVVWRRAAPDVADAADPNVQAADA